VAGRYGGEEFLVILPRTSLDEALRIGERIRGKIEDVFRESFRATISIGVSFYPDDGTDATALIRAADQALLHSKRTGKNRVTAAGDIGKAD
jgi:diguanylate cyclase (GGDEF)-like protein